LPSSLAVDIVNQCRFANLFIALAEKHVSDKFSVPLLRVISYLIKAEIDVTEHISGHTKLTEVVDNRQFVELFVISNPFFSVFSSCVYS
jgi:hypothetical protein